MLLYGDNNLTQRSEATSAPAFIVELFSFFETLHSFEILQTQFDKHKLIQGLDLSTVFYRILFCFFLLVGVHNLVSLPSAVLKKKMLKFNKIIFNCRAIYNLDCVKSKGWCYVIRGYHNSGS